MILALDKVVDIVDRLCLGDTVTVIFVGVFVDVIGVGVVCVVGVISVIF